MEKEANRAVIETQDVDVSEDLSEDEESVEKEEENDHHMEYLDSNK